jgi:hypothetical protein
MRSLNDGENLRGTLSIEEPTKKPRWHAPVRLIAVSAVLMLVGCGLCSAGGFSLEGTDTHPVVVGFGAVAFWSGLAGFFAGVLWWLVALVSG